MEVRLLTQGGVCQGLGEGPGHGGHQRVISPGELTGQDGAYHDLSPAPHPHGGLWGWRVSTESLWDPGWSRRGHGRASCSRLRAPTPRLLTAKSAASLPLHLCDRRASLGSAAGTGGCAAKPGRGSRLGRVLCRVFSSHQPRGRACAQDGEGLPMGALLTGPAAHRPRSAPPLPVPSSCPTAAGRPAADAERAQRCPSLCFSPGLDLPSAESEQVLGEAAATLQLSGGSRAGQAGD